MNWNAIIFDPTHPDSWKRELQWAEKVYKQASVLPVNICLPVEFDFTLESIGLFDNLSAWNEATVGTLEEHKAKLADPARLSLLKTPNVSKSLEFWDGQP